MMIKRVVVSLICIPIILGTMYIGGFALLTLLGLVTLLATFEMRKMFAHKYPQVSLVIIPLNVVFFLYFTLIPEHSLLISSVIIIAAIIGYDVVTSRIEGSILRASLCFFMVIYISYFLSFAYHIRNLLNGHYLLIAIVVVIWITDSVAYFTGIAIGKHKGIFKVSPKKSLEGFIGGFVFALLSSYLLYLAFGQIYSLQQAIAIGLTAGIFGQLGDLVESILKRDTGVKDSSQLIPGHGGVLDRFDSFIFSLPVFYLINQILSRLY